MPKPVARTLACLLTTATVLALWLSALLIVALRQPDDVPLMLPAVSAAASATTMARTPGPALAAVNKTLR
jgi:hypothetical protein